MRYMLVIAATFCAVVPTNGKQAGTKPSKKQQSRHAAQAPKNNTINIDTVNVNKLNVAEQANSSDKADQNTNRPPSYLRRLIAAENLPNLILCFVGAAGVGAAICTLRTINRQTNIMVDSERAWIFVGIDNVQEPSPIDLGIVITPTVKNSGKTVARVVKFCVQYTLVKSPDGLGPEPNYLEKRTVETSFMVPSNAPLQPMAVGIPQQEFQDAMDAKQFLYVYGYVDYIVLEKYRKQTRFCLMYYSKLASYGPLKPGFYIGIQAPEAYKKCS